MNKLNIKKESDIDVFAKGFLTQELNCKIVRCEVPRFSNNDHADYMGLTGDGMVIALECKINPDKKLFKQILRNEYISNLSIGFIPKNISKLWLARAKKENINLVGIGENSFIKVGQLWTAQSYGALFYALALRYADWNKYSQIGGIKEGKRISYYEMFEQTVEGIYKDCGCMPVSIAELLSKISRYSNNYAMKKIIKVVKLKRKGESMADKKTEKTKGKKDELPMEIEETPIGKATKELAEIMDKISNLKDEAGHQKVLIMKLMKEKEQQKLTLCGLKMTINPISEFLEVKKV